METLINHLPTIPDLAEKQAAAKAAPVRENVSISPCDVHKITSAVSVHNEIEKWEKEGKIFVIRPSVPLSIGRMEADPKKLKEVYELGRDDALRQIAAMKEWLN